MAAVQILYADTTVEQITTDSSEGYEDAAAIPSGSFTAGDTYLIVAQMFTTSNSATIETRARLQHGTTNFTDAEYFVEIQGAGANGGWQHTWLYVFTQPGGGAEAITLAFGSTGADDVTMHHSSLTALNLSDLVEDEDWWENEVTADYTNTTTFVSQASVTLTANSLDSFLLLAHAVINVNDATVQCEAMLHDSVAGLIGALWSVEGEDATAETSKSLFLAHAVTPLMGSHTFSIQTRDEAGGVPNDVLSSRIVVLRLDSFAQFFANVTSAELALTAAFQTAETESVTPGVTGDWWYMGFCSHDVELSTNELLLRLQDDNDGSMGSDPDYGDDMPGDWALDSTDEGTFYLQKMKPLTSGGSRTINFDVAATATAGIVEDRLLVGFSAELSSVIDPPGAIAWVNA